jgi:hypothetical protein
MKKANAPAIMELASMEAYDFPSLATVSPNVASATEGAAAKSPAKLLGLKRSPRIAKIETTTPPIKNRMTITFIRGKYARPATSGGKDFSHSKLFFTSFSACFGPLILSTLNFLPFSLLYVTKNCSISFSMLLFRSFRLFASE